MKEALDMIQFNYETMKTIKCKVQYTTFFMESV